MAISERQVKNGHTSSGKPTGKPGIVYDVNIKYKAAGKYKTYSKKGFRTEKDARTHEAEMHAKLGSPAYVPPSASQCKLTTEEYLIDWVKRHGAVNLRPSTRASYESHLRNHVYPNIGNVPLRQLTPAILDDLYKQLSENGLSQSSVKYAHRILGVALEHARKYHYIESNPARDTITKFGKQGKTPAPYTIEEMQLLMGRVIGTPWELIIVLGGLYGLRISEILGLRWHNVDLEGGTFGVIEQLPYNPPSSMRIIEEMAPVKSSERYLPITETTRSFFERQKEIQVRQRASITASGGIYYDGDLVVCEPDGSWKCREKVSANFGQLLRHSGLRHIRFHDLRHSAATNIHELTGDFYTVSQCLGHSLKGVGIQLNISTNLDSVTAKYIDVRLDRKRIVLEAYHKAVFLNQT